MPPKGRPAGDGIRPSRHPGSRAPTPIGPEMPRNPGSSAWSGPCSRGVRHEPGPSPRPQRHRARDRRRDHRHLAAIAIPNVVRHQLRVKYAELPLQVRTIHQGEIALRQSERVAAVGAAPGQFYAFAKVPDGSPKEDMKASFTPNLAGDPDLRPIRARRCRNSRTRPTRSSGFRPPGGPRSTSASGSRRARRRVRGSPPRWSRRAISGNAVNMAWTRWTGWAMGFGFGLAVRAATWGPAPAGARPHTDGTERRGDPEAAFKAEGSAARSLG
jgi:hypothetical protein